ncbi:MAG TPA: phytanoyl-CoA dioxygenase family protein [Saprospiraceae bacterium]|nr:phytanoyl-CoA dioxygenase family protein [Saprospiraceae bacterium]HMP24400.1 phytanoyl-CoA dioxygenase family protein [Saprospiraceae bacterium]
MLKNKIHQEKLDRDGYVVVNFFAKSEIEALVSAYEALHQFNLGQQMFFSNRQMDNPQYQQQARQLIREHFAHRINDFFSNAAWMEAVFVIKPPGGDVFANHQDWTLVNEAQHRSLGIWCPLLDVNASNGTFCILSGSHRFFDTFRSPTIPAAYHTDELNAIIDAHKTVLNVRLGDAIIFDHAAVHSTTPNRSNRPRGAVFIGIRPADSPILHFFYDKDTKRIEGFEVDGDFFYTYDYVSRPIGYKSIGFVEPEFPVVPTDALMRKIKRHQRQRWHILNRLKYRLNGIKG